MQKRIPTVTPLSASILSTGNQEIIDFSPPQGQMDLDIIIDVLYYTKEHDTALQSQ